MGAAGRVAVYRTDAFAPTSAVVATEMRAVEEPVAPGATVSVVGPVNVDVIPGYRVVTVPVSVNVDDPHGPASALRTLIVSFEKLPREMEAVVGVTVTTGVPRVQTDGVGDGLGPMLGVGVGEGATEAEGDGEGATLALGFGVGPMERVGNGVGVTDGTGVGLPPPTAAATALAASTIPEPQPWGQPPDPNGCAFCWMSCVTCAGVSDGLAANRRAATPATCGVAMLVPW